MQPVQPMLASIKHVTGCCFESPFRSMFDKIVSLLNWYTWTLLGATKLSYVLNGWAVTHANIFPQHVRRHAGNITHISSILQWFFYASTIELMNNKLFHSSPNYSLKP